MTDDLDQRRQELFSRAVDSIMVGVSEAFDTIWQRPDALAIVAAFLEDKLAFQIDHRGITIAVRPDEGDAPVSGTPDTPPADPPPPSTGHYL